MNYVIDLSILAIIFICTLIGYKKGLIKLAFGLFSFIIALIISLLLYKPISSFIVKHTPIASYIEAKVENRIVSSTPEETSNFASNYYHNVKNVSANFLASNISNSIINIMSVLLVFIISKLLLLFLKFTGDFLSKLPLIKQCNHLGGFLYGIILGFLLIYILLTIIAILAPLVDLNKIITLINASIIGNIMYNNNIIFMFFM